VGAQRPPQGFDLHGDPHLNCEFESHPVSCLEAIRRVSKTPLRGSVTKSIAQPNLPEQVTPNNNVRRQCEFHPPGAGRHCLD
jgi:hypothetical protein